MARREEIIKKQDEAIRSLEVISDTCWLLTISFRLTRVIITPLLLKKKMIYDILHVTFLTNSGMLPYDINLHSLNPFCECLFKLIIRSTNCQPFSFITLFNFA